MPPKSSLSMRTGALLFISCTKVEEAVLFVSLFRKASRMAFLRHWMVEHVGKGYAEIFGRVALVNESPVMKAYLRRVRFRGEAVEC